MKIKSKTQVYMQGVRNSHRNLEEDKRAVACTSPDTKKYYKSIIIKIMWYCNMNRKNGLWTRVRPEPNLFIYNIYKYLPGLI